MAVLTWSKCKYGERFSCGGHGSDQGPTSTEVLGQDGDSRKKCQTVTESCKDTYSDTNDKYVYTPWYLLLPLT